MVVLFRAIKPSKPFVSSIFREEIEKAAQALKKDMLEDFKRATATWSEPVKFQSKVETGAGVHGVKISVDTKDKRFIFTDKGTRPHVIKPKRAKALAFASKFEPKTEPDVVLSTKGKKGKVDRLAKVVHHPGTRARNFSKHIAKSFAPTFRKEIKNALERAARRSGYLRTR